MDFVSLQRAGNVLRPAMAFNREPRQIFVGGDLLGSSSSATQKLTSSSDVVENELMPSGSRGSRLFQKEGEAASCLHVLPIRTMGVRRTENRDWNAEGTNGIPIGDRSGGIHDENDDELDYLEEGNGAVEGRIFQKGANDDDQSNGSSDLHFTAEKVRQNTPDLLASHSSSVLAKDVKSNPRMENFSAQQSKQDRAVDDDEPNSLSGTESFCTQTSQDDGQAKNQKELQTENRDDLSRGKEISSSTNSGENLHALLSDPLTGVLMDDAMILFCGHSYGSMGMQHILRMKYCYKCQQPVSEEKMLPNLVLRAAVRAFRREKEFLSPQPGKRKRERSDQAKGDYMSPLSMELSRSKNVHFPFVVSDRVIIKGNKRTPERLTGRIAIVTAQCLSGWYEVKTLDSGEIFKLQCRSLAKVADDHPAS